MEMRGVCAATGAIVIKIGGCRSLPWRTSLHDALAFLRISTMTFEPTFSTEIEGCRFMVGRMPLCAEDVPADVIINVCHLPGVTLAPNGKEVFWFPINEAAVWGYATIFAAKKVLDQKLRRERKSVYLHCEQGQIRSMLVAMLWLQSFGAGAGEALENRQCFLSRRFASGICLSGSSNSWRFPRVPGRHPLRPAQPNARLLFCPYETPVGETEVMDSGHHS